MKVADINSEFQQYLKNVGHLPDDEVDVGLTALALAAPAYVGRSLERYKNHLKKLQKDVQARHASLLKEGADDTAETRLSALAHILHAQEGYDGDSETYDDVKNADLIAVIERRKGMPIALGILYIATGQALGWDVCGLQMPGHFICRLEKEGQRLIFDPFNGGSILNAAEMRELVKQALGEYAELSTTYYEPATNRDILIRLQNNIKLRLIEAEAYQEALHVVEAMRRVDPKEYRLLLDAGVLYARIGQHMAAARALEDYIDKAPNPKDRREAAILLQQVREALL